MFKWRDYSWNEDYSDPYLTQSPDMVTYSETTITLEHLNRLIDRIVHNNSDNMIYKRINRINLKKYNVSELSELLEAGESIRVSSNQININLNDSDKWYEAHSLNRLCNFGMVFELLTEAQNIRVIEIIYTEDDSNKVIIRIKKTDDTVFVCDVRDAILVFEYNSGNFVEMIDGAGCTFNYAMMKKGYELLTSEEWKNE